MERMAEAHARTSWSSAEAVCERAARLARHALGASFVGIHSTPSGPDDISCIAYDAEPVSCDDTMQLCRRLLARDDSAEPHHAGGSFVFAPITLADRTVGVICAYAPAPNAFDTRAPEVLALLATDIAEHLAWGAERARLDEAEAQAAARNDTLANLAIALRDHLRIVATFSDHMRHETGGDPNAIDPSGQARPDDRSLGGPPVSTEATEGRPARILLADDLDLNRKLISDMLTIDGHVVECVEDGKQAVAAVSLRRYDLVLMDVVMPGMDGLTATRAIRALPLPASTVPILALTANSYGEQLKDCIAAGMDATLVKPMSLDDLATAVQTWTGRRHTRAA